MKYTYIYIYIYLYIHDYILYVEGHRSLTSFIRRAYFGERGSSNSEMIEPVEAECLQSGRPAAAAGVDCFETVDHAALGGMALRWRLIYIYI